MVIVSSTQMVIFFSWFFLAENVFCIQVVLEGQKTGTVKKKVFLGAQTQLACSAWNTVPGKITVIWTYKKSEKDEGVGAFIVENYVNKEYQKYFYMKDSTTLIIKKPGENDSGIYTCILENWNDMQSTNDRGYYNLLVIYPPTKPYCRYPNDRYLRNGHHQKVSCVTDAGAPQPLYKWYKDNDLMPTNSLVSPKYKDFHFEYDERTGVLEFTSANDNNAGVYHCMAYNDAGSNRSMPFKLRVLHTDVGQIVGITTASISVFVLVGVIAVCRRRACPNDEDEMQSSNEGANDIVLDGSGPQIVKSLPVPMSKRPKSSIII